MTEPHMPVTDYQVEKLRKQLAFLLRDGRAYRAVLTDSESADGVMLACTSPNHPADDKLAQWGVYDCCDLDVQMETYHETSAAFFVSATIAIPALLAEREHLAGRIAQLEFDQIQQNRIIHDQANRIAELEDAADLALVQSRAAIDNGNRTPLADVLTEHGLTENDMEATD